MLALADELIVKECLSLQFCFLFLCLSRYAKYLPAAWCGAGADHYEPLIATVLQHVTPDKAAVLL